MKSLMTTLNSQISWQEMSNEAGKVGNLQILDLLASYGIWTDS